MSERVDVTAAATDGILRAQLSDGHLRVCLDDEDVADGAAGGALREHADVLYFRRVVSAEEVAAQLAVFPGCLVCAGPGEGGSVVLAVRGNRRGHDCGLIASALHVLLATGLCVG